MSYGTVQAEKVTTESGYSLGAGNATSFKNRIINGGMTISQRNGTSVVTPAANGDYTLDRFSVPFLGGGVFTVQQSTTAPAGFRNSAQLTVTTADSSLGAGDYYGFQQYIEGLNAYDLGFGTADAKSVTLSFWVRSSIAGTYCVWLNGTSGGRSYVATYTINSTNTWEYKTITIPGDTTGTWPTDNSAWGRVWFTLGGGSNFTSTAGSWQSGSYFQTSAQTQWISTNGATFNITGVQLEVGTVATSFDFRSYGTELALCQRYYQIYATPTHRFFGSSTYTAGVTVSYEQLGVEMRATPTLAQSGGGTTGVLVNTSTGATSTVTVYLYQPASSVRAFQFYPDGATNGQVYFVAGLPNILCSAEL